MMSRTLKLPVLFLAIACVLFAGLYVLSTRVAPVYPDVERRMELMKQQADAIEVLAVGNSHNVAVDFEVLGVDGFHLWRPAGDLFETKYIIETTAPQLSSLECVLLPASYFLLRRDNAATVTTNHAERRRELYATTESFHFLDGDFKRFIQAKLTPVARPDHWKGVVEGLAGKKPPHFPVREDGLIVYFENEDSLSTAFLDLHAEELARKHIDLQNEMMERHATVVQDAYAALEGIAEYLREREIQLVLFTPPVYAEYTRRFDRETTEQMKALVSRLERAYDNVQYVDLSGDSTLTRTPSLYRDSDHLNAQGARVFSERLRRAIMAQGQSSARCTGPSSIAVHPQ